MNRPYDLETMADTLEASGEYRIARRLKPLLRPSSSPDPSARLGLVVDVETTGLDPARDEIIELAMIPFRYRTDGEILGIGEGFHRLREPGVAISPRITEITGITEEMVAGHVIDRDEVARFVQPVSLVVAHNAAFDRRFLERFSDAFSTKPWACTLTQIDWASEGFECAKLAYLAQASGFFYDRHRAENDCLATIELLANPLPRSGARGLSRLLDAARTPHWRIWAEGSPYESKEVLKARGYRWNPIAAAQPRSWYVDVAESQCDSELDFLAAEIYGRDVDLHVTRIDAYDRFSDRV